MCRPGDPGESGKARYLDDGTLVLPRTMNRVVALAFEMDYAGVSTYPSAVACSATGRGYSHMAETAASLAEFIRGLGYSAVPCGNQTALSIPLAIDAGLGELGRNGLLVTKRFGPRVRLAKVFTDMPLAVDQPVRFGVTEFCDVCKKCADLCPGQAIPHGERSREAHSVSNNPGTLKWAVKGENCMRVWQHNGFTDCGTCVRCCPFNKPPGLLHDSVRLVIKARSRKLDKLMLWGDELFGYGKQQPADGFWDR